ncbi:Arc family DNA-binding protein [Klebsiella pneumoniae]|uniref:Arc family DNA-binding protein n=1 Tax=Klebsiella pneumoniae TaxID=573 RepID=UPI00059126A8|nr:Arc family DNA-binding protein [Klebsiella pneumoniae]EKU0835893.1 Arc family DNA-binding protein [Klebsiella pneumoniae]MBE9306866.1 Arc family DNA-binding protein [Klebsiella pneumoniae]MDT0793703.1 Arc family DNA-binding protein [Klebsiella pneumoniae subsp. pneumoniae]MTF22604.1 Arc family DNA-binding protein [Klebsiella pneumoniae]PXG95174.1 Arc family DNA-binding protein [Klebsiella pneumoniae]
MSKFPSQEMDRFNVRLPVGMRDAIADRAKRNGRSMNSEIVQILQDALETEKLIAETDIVDFDSTQAVLDSKSTPEEKAAFLSELEERDPFTAAILREGEEHNRRLAAILGKRMGYLDNDK